MTKKTRFLGGKNARFPPFSNNFSITFVEEKKIDDYPSQTSFLRFFQKFDKKKDVNKYFFLPHRLITFFSQLRCD